MSASSRRIIATALAGEPGIVSDRSRCSRGAQRRSRQQCHGSRPLRRPSGRVIANSESQVAAMTRSLGSAGPQARTVSRAGHTEP
eukprot:1118453-Prymnesium_polylepis.1